MSETEAATAWEAYAAYQHGNLIHRNSLEGQSCPSVPYYCTDIDTLITRIRRLGLYLEMT